jgi:hypothetical protein
VYYIRESTDPNTFIPSPDGLQSLPTSVRTKILEEAAKQTGVSASQLYIRWVDAQFFQGCLNPAEPEMSCGDTIRSGWRVEVLGGQSTTERGWETPLSIYHANLTGTDIRLIEQGSWSPAPSAPPPTF